MTGNKNNYMKQTLITILSFAVLSANGQTPNGLILKKGMVIESELLSYKTPLFADAARWTKMKPGKRDNEVLKFNEEVAAGKIAPVGKMTLPTAINNVEGTGNMAIYNGTTRIGQTDYKLRIAQMGDTTHFMLNAGLNFPIVNKTDTTGVWCYGIRKYPMKPVVGSFIPGYINEMNLFPYDLTTNRRNFFEVDGGNGYSYSGFVNIRKKHKMTVSSIIMNTPYFVSGTEDMQIAGKTFTAYKLLNAQWTKTTTNDVATEDATTFFDNERLNTIVKNNLSMRARGENKEAVDKLLKTAAEKTGMTANEYGYMENYQENWYVPELGMIVKSKFYDAYGALQMESKVVAIKE